MPAAVMRSLTDLLADPARRAGVTAVLDAADTAADKLSAAQFVASFAPPVTSFSSCVCGSVRETRGSGQIKPTPEERAAAAEAVADISGRPRDAFCMQIATRVINAINHERAVADADADREWDDEHAFCGGDD